MSEDRVMAKPLNAVVRVACPALPVDKMESEVFKYNRNIESLSIYNGLLGSCIA
jgi:hypothetical protein